MKSISIDDDLFLEIDRFATGIFTHSDVIRKLLSKSPSQKNELKVNATNVTSAPKGSIIEFVQSSQYQALRKTVDRYLAILSWVNKNRSQEFLKVESFQRGKRTYFARSQQAITHSGKGNIRAKQIPNSTLWTLVTLQSTDMRGILVNVLRMTGFATDEISAVAQTIQPKQQAISDINIKDLMG